MRTRRQFGGAVLGLAALGLLLGLTGEVRAGFTQIVAFGDSLTDEGNVFLGTNGTFPASPPYYQGRFSNGPVWLEDLASLLSLPNPMPSLAGGTDYAFGGAETHSASGLSSQGTPNLDTQIGMYLAGHHSFNSGQLIAVWGGANDFLNAGQTDPSVPVSNLAQEITTIAQAGGRYFLIPNLPPLGETPAIKSLGSPALEAFYNSLSSQFDSLLAAEEHSLQASLGITIYSVDVSSLVEGILSNPASFGFTNVTDQAKSGGEGTPGSVVPNPNQYLFWDPVHPTAPGHQLIGDAAFIAVTAPEPSTASLLCCGVLGLVGYGWRRRKAA
jgi:phospholipase/lecithinase/hemolysin